MRTHKDLKIWQEGLETVSHVYALTKTFPEFEKYGLASQMQRCTISIPSNIAEGAARNSRKEFVKFLYISLGSLAELETQLIIANKLEYIDDNRLETFNKDIELLRKKLLNFIKYQRRKIDAQ